MKSCAKCNREENVVSIAEIKKTETGPTTQSDICIECLMKLTDPAADAVFGVRKASIATAIVAWQDGYVCGSRRGMRYGVAGGIAAAILATAIIRAIAAWN